MLILRFTIKVLDERDTRLDLILIKVNDSISTRTSLIRICFMNV